MDEKDFEQNDRLATLLFKEVKGMPGFIYSDRMILDAIKNALPNNVKDSEKEFINYFCGNSHGETSFNSDTMKKIFHNAYPSKGNPKMLKKMMKYVNEKEGTELSLETVCVKLTREQSQIESRCSSPFDNINAQINTMQIQAQSFNFNGEVMKILREFFDKKGECYFRFQLKLYQLYVNIHLRYANGMDLAKVIENLISFEEFNQMFLKKTLADKQYEKKIDKLLMKLTVNYSYEMIRRCVYG